jgi:hypothetical protein
MGIGAVGQWGVGMIVWVFTVEDGRLASYFLLCLDAGSTDDDRPSQRRHLGRQSR